MSLWESSLLLPLPRTRWVWTNRPVRKEARLGEQREVVTKALENLQPSAAMRSMLGVLAKGWPDSPAAHMQEGAVQRRSSTRMKMMLGRCGAAEAGNGRR